MAQLSVVTGGGGFVGRHLVSSLLQRGDRVRVLDVADPRDLQAALPGAEIVRVDITDAKAVREACEGAGAVFHNASLVHTKQNKADFVWNVNYGGTENVFAACQDLGIGKFIYVSSGSVVYDGKNIINGNESLPYAESNQAPYAHSKVQAEKMILARNGEGGVATTAIRPHVIFGPGDTRFLPAVLEHARSGRLRVQVGLGVWLSDYTYVQNLVDSLLLADERLSLDSPVAGSAYFITNGEPMAFWEFVRRVLARLGLPPIRAKIPKEIPYAIAAIKEGIDTLRGGTISPEDGLTRFAIRYMCTHHFFSIEKARRELGYDSKVSIDEGIEITCRHLEETGAV